jgi:hypothetical protein
VIFRSFVRWLGTEPVTVRIDVDPEQEASERKE